MTTELADAVSNKFNSAAVVVTAVPPIFSLSFTILIVAPPTVSNASSDASHNICAPSVAPNSLTS